MQIIGFAKIIELEFPAKRMKREVPATPFKVDGPNSTWTSSTESPEKMADQPSGQSAMMPISDQPANPAQEATAVANRPKRGQGSAGASGGSAQWGGSSASGQQIPPSLHQHNTIQQHMYQQQVNQIDPVQLEQLLESLVNAKAEANYQQIRQQAQQEVEQIRIQAGSNQQMLQEQVFQKLSQLNQEKQMLELREQRTQEQAQQQIEQLQHKADSHITRLSDDNRRLQAQLEETRKSAEGQVAFVQYQAEAERQRAVAELRELSSKLEVAHQKLMGANKDAYSHPDRVASATGSVMGSPMLNPFDHLPQAYQSAQHTEIMSAGASVASANPLEVMFCTCCGSQNVIGRPSCWRCSTLLSTVTAKNGADLRLQDHRVESAPCPPPSLAPSSFRALQGVAAGSASIAAPAAVPKAMNAGLPGGCASNAAPSGILAPGGLMGQTGCGLGVGSTGGMAHQWGNFDPNGPRIQAGYIVPGRGPQNENPKHTGHQNSQHGGAENFSIHTPKHSSTADGSSPSSSKGSNGEGLVQHPKDGWLLPDETDESVYKHKHLRSIQITKLPNDATSCREWRAAFLAAVSRVDMTNRDVLVKFSTWCMEGGRGRRFRDFLQNSNDFLLFNKHVAAELIKPEVLATNSELAHELTSWVESCSAKQQGPKGMALMHIIIAFYETGPDQSIALNQMHLLQLQLQGKTAKDLAEFVKRGNYILHGLRPGDRPAEATLYSWLWHQVKAVPMLRRCTDKIRESSSGSRRRTFSWLWGKIAEELRERRHDMNYENMGQGLKSSPPAQLALPASSPAGETKAAKVTKTKTTAKKETKPAAAAPTEAPRGHVCALHAAGHCRFGTRCRNTHVGEPGSDEARKAYSDAQKAKPKGQEKGSKGDGKGKKGKKGEAKGSKGGTGTPAAVAAAASTVTITEVEGKQAQKTWQSFCKFCDKALPSLNTFLKLSVPILATLISSITNSYEQIGEVAAASMVDPAVQNFKKFSLEFLGDTGAAHDIGSLRALQDQGLTKDMVEPWIKTLESPVRFATGGGAQLSTEALRMYTKELGDFNIHLLSSCPMALSIGKQVSRGRTFIWQHGQKPYIALDHRKCRVWCPKENRWYADRVQHNVPIFSIQSPLKPGRVIRDGAACTQLEQSANCADMLEQPAMCADESTEEFKSHFCGSCMERLNACVCHITAVKGFHEHTESNEDCTVDPLCLASMRDHEHDGDVPQIDVADLPVHPGIQDAIQRRRQHRKDNRRRKWEKLKNEKPNAPTQKPIVRGVAAVETMMNGLKEFYNDCSKHHDKQTSELYQSISRCIAKELSDFNDSAAEVAIPEPHHPGLPGHGSLVEFCTSAESMMGKVGKDLGVYVVRCSEGHLNVESDKTMEILHGMVESKPGLDLWGSLPCDPWTQWQTLNVHQYGQDFADRLEERRKASRKLVKKFCKLARAVARRGGRVTFEWPRFCAGWSLQEIQKLIRDLNMMIVDFDGCQVGLTDSEGNLHLKRWRLITTCNRTARVFSTLRCNHPSGFQHAPVSGSRTHKTGFYPREMCEYVMHAMYPDIISRHVPAMPVTAITGEPQEHREREPEEEPEVQGYIFESTDPMAAAAEVVDEPADDEAEEDRETRDDRLKREAMSLEHLTLHAKKNPFCPHCQRGRMIKRYAHRHRPDPEDEEVVYNVAKEFGSIIEADHIFPSVESRGLGGEQSALLVRDRYSGMCLTYPQRTRSEDSNYDALKHFGGNKLNGNPDVVFHSDTAQELTNAASRLGWVADPSAANYWPHNAYVEREIRTIKEMCRPSHLQAGFHRRLWTISIEYTATARSFFTPAPITADECNTEEGKKKLGKTRWEVATGKPFDGVSYPLGALVFYRSKGDGMAEPTTKPGLFAGWHLAPGLRYKGNVKILDYESVRERSHLHWQPRVLHEKEVYFPPTEYIEFPLALAAHTAMLQMTDEEKEVKKAIYDRSFVEGVLPYDVCIDAFPVDSPPPPPRHAYITWARLLKHGFTKGCAGCSMGHNRHSPECKARFDAIFSRRGESVGPTPKPILDGEETDYEPSIAPEQFPGDEVPECPPRSDDEELQPAAVTRQLPRSEVLSREDAIAAIKKEFDGIGAMGTWDLGSVEEEESVKKRAIESGQTIHLADLLAICSEKHVELEPKYRSLKGRVCYRGDQARNEKGNLALYQTMSASPASITAANAIISYGLMCGHKISSADAIKAYLQSLLNSLAETWVRLPREVWPASWFGEDGRPLFKRPVIRLLRSLYGHPEAGAHWERKLEQELLSMGATKIPEFPSTYIFPSFGHLALVVYVDDFLLAGDSSYHEAFWAELSKRIMLDDVGDIGRFLGRHHSMIKYNDQDRFAFDMRAYAESIVNDYCQLVGHAKLKKVNTPFLSKTTVVEDSPARGELATSASSVLMKLMWLARLARPDMLRVTTWLATKVQQWTTECDNHLFRAISYLNETKEHLLSGHVGDDMGDIFIELYCDADFCGDDEHTYSTSGGWIQLSGKNTQFPIAWMSRKQGAVSRSTTEAEAVAMATTLFDEGLPLLELFSALFRRSVRLLIREDNEATAKIVSAGYSKRLRHMKRTHRINLGSLKDELDKDDVDLQLVASKYQKADIFTKGLAGDLWGNALDLLGIISQYSVTSTTHTGLKMHEEDFNEALQPSHEVTPAPKPKAKASVRKKYKKKAPRILPYLKAPEDDAQ